MIIYIKMDLVLNNVQMLICHKTKPNQTKPNYFVSLGSWCEWTSVYVFEGLIFLKCIFPLNGFNVRD